MSFNPLGQSHRQSSRLWVGLFLLSLSGCGQTVIESEESRMAIDALYTAVTSRRTDLVDACEQRLQSLSAAGEIPPATSRQLADIIAKARQKQWQPAAERLDRLIRGIAP